MRLGVRIREQMNWGRFGFLSLLAGAAALMAAPPQITLNNGTVRAVVYPPDATEGFYRGTRFDWSGVVGSLEVGGKRIFGQWYSVLEPGVKDIAYREAEGGFVAGRNSGAVGPVEEFVGGEGGAIGYAESAPGGMFLKPGVGWLKRPDAGEYDRFHLYEVVDGGKWTVTSGPAEVEFVQRLTRDGRYAYEYRKKLVLPEGKAELHIIHSLKNLGSSPIETDVYNHNFLTLDNTRTGPAVRVKLPFKPEALRSAEGPLVLGEREIGYSRELRSDESASVPVGGFGSNSSSYNICVVNEGEDVGVRITGDRPLTRLFFWSLRSVVSPEPYIHLRVEPGSVETWTIQYAFGPCD